MGYTAGLTEEQNVNGGPTFGLSLRLASVLSLADIQVTALASTYQAKVGDVDLDILRISTGAEVHLHPFFLMTLRNTLIWNWLAGIYASVGADLDLTQIGEGAIEPDFGWHTGVGMDIPLTPPEVGSSLWLGLAYRIKFLEVLGPGDEETNFNEHTIVLTIGYRDNDINFMRMPRPTELYESIKKDGE